MNTNLFLVRVITTFSDTYALWALDKLIPAGWWDAGKSGTLQECLAFIDAHNPIAPPHLYVLKPGLFNQAD